MRKSVLYQLISIFFLAYSLCIASSATPPRALAAPLIAELNNNSTLTQQRATDILAELRRMKVANTDHANAVQGMGLAESKLAAFATAKKLADEAERHKREAALKAAEDATKREQALAAAAEAERLKAEAEAARIKAYAAQDRKKAQRQSWKKSFITASKRAALLQALEQASGDIVSLFPQKSYGELWSALYVSDSYEDEVVSSGSFSKTTAGETSSSSSFDYLRIAGLSLAQQQQLAARLGLLDAVSGDINPAAKPEKLIKQQIAIVTSAVRTAKAAIAKSAKPAQSSVAVEAKPPLRSATTQTDPHDFEYTESVQPGYKTRMQRVEAENKVLREALARYEAPVAPGSVDQEFLYMQRRVYALTLENAELRAQVAPKSTVVSASDLPKPIEPLPPFNFDFDKEFLELMNGMKKRDDEASSAAVAEQEKLKKEVIQLKAEITKLTERNRLAVEHKDRVEKQSLYLTQEIIELRNNMRVLEDEKKSLEARITLLPPDSKERRGATSVATKKSQSSDKRLEGLTLQMSEMAKQYDASLSKQTELDALNRELRGKIHSELAAKKELQRECVVQTQANQRLEEELDMVRTQLRSQEKLEERLALAVKMNAAYRTEFKRFRMKIMRLKEAVQEAKSMRDQLGRQVLALYRNILPATEEVEAKIRVDGSILLSGVLIRLEEIRREITAVLPVEFADK